MRGLYLEKSSYQTEFQMRHIDREVASPNREYAHMYKEYLELNNRKPRTTAKRMNEIRFILRVLPKDAKLATRRDIENAVIKIKNFISPTIIERLSIDARLVKPKITDFRSMIDVVLIDTAYNGKVFNITYSDVPEKKDDFVEGAYKLPIRKSKSVVAVKIIDMLGEEIILTKEI